MQDSSAHSADAVGVGGPAGGSQPGPYFAVRHEGSKYRFSGEHYDRLLQAISTDAPGQEMHVHAGENAVESPTDTDRLVMSVLGISYSDGVYGYEGFRCDRLADAVTYAYLRRHTPGVGPSW